MAEGLLDLARPQDIRLKGAATVAATLLPQDTHYEVNALSFFHCSGFKNQILDLRTRSSATGHSL